MDSSYNNGGIIASGPDSPDVPLPSANNIVIDGGGGPRQSKKGLLIAGIALTGIALVVGVVAIIMMGRGDTGTVVDEKTARNNATRYMLFGNVETDNEITDVKANDAYFMRVSEMWGYEEQQGYFATLKSYLKDLKNTAKGAEMSTFASRLNTDVVLFEKTSALAHTDAILTIFMENGADGVQNYISEVEGLEISDGAPVNILENIQELGTALTKIYTTYNDRGCINDSGIDEECTINIVNNNASLMNSIDKAVSLRLKLGDNAESLGRLMFADIMAVNGVKNELPEGAIVDEGDQE